MTRVEVEDLTEELAVAWRPVVDPTDPASASGKYDVFPRSDLEKYAEAAGPACGMWAFEALRIARGEPRLGLDTDHRTIPNEMGWIPSAVHLDKGCYRGQETVARVHTLGRPPRRLTLLHLDGSDNRLPTRGAPVLNGETRGRLRRQLCPPPRARPDRAGPAQAQRAAGCRARCRRAGRFAGGRGRSRGRAARAPAALGAVSRSACAADRGHPVTPIRGTEDSGRPRKAYRAASRATARAHPHSGGPQHYHELRSGRARSVEHLSPGKPDARLAVHGGVEVALKVSVTRGDGVVEEAAVELDDAAPVVLCVAVDDPC